MVLSSGRQIGTSQTIPFAVPRLKSASLQVMARISTNKP